MKKYRKTEEIINNSEGKRAERIKKALDSSNSVFAGVDGYIDDQASSSLHGLTYGKYPVSYNGCECVAVYNALISKGKRVSLPDLLCEFEENGLIGYYLFGKHSFFRGKFGTNPKKIKRALDAYGIDYEIFKNEEAFTANMTDGGYIASFVNGGRITKGVHTFFFMKKDGIFEVFNGYGSKNCYSYGDVKKSGGFIMAYAIR